MSKKQAVLLIHGIGEQKPMDSVREFVNTVWTTNEELHRDFGPDASKVWSKPYGISESFELRRLTTGKNKNGIRTDFFELYWAHMIEDTTFDHLVDWLKTVLLRKPNRVPTHLKFEYWLLWSVIVFSVGFATYRSLFIEAALENLPLWLAAGVFLTGLLTSALRQFLFNDVVGDAARYLNRSPKNVKIRHEIRKLGIDVLKNLHQGEYSRIVVVGHSLGSVIGYDILTHTWAELSEQFEEFQKEQKTTKLEQLEETMCSIIGQDSIPEEQLSDVRDLQREYLEESKDNTQPWLVSDFITLGSPLAHSEILLARSKENLKQKLIDREFPMCPPLFEEETVNKKTRSRFSYTKKYEPQGEAAVKKRIAHHAAVFAPTRWTNLYFPKNYLIGGDLIGGPVSPIFGKAIKDVPVRTNIRGGILTHTSYWTLKDDDSGNHIQELRNALNLLDE